MYRNKPTDDDEPHSTDISKHALNSLPKPTGLAAITPAKGAHLGLGLGG